MAREGFYHVIDKLCKRIGAEFYKGFHEPPSGILIYGSVRAELLPNDPAIFNAGRRYELHIHMDTLTGILHLLIGFRDVCRIWADAVPGCPVC